MDPLDLNVSQSYKRRLINDDETNLMFLDQKMVDDNEENRALYERKDLVTSVPFKVFKVENPNMRTINKEMFDNMEYSNWTET